MKAINTRYVEISEARTENFKMTEYQERDLKEKREDLKEFSKFGELVEVVTYNTHEEKLYFEHVTILLKYKGIFLMPTKPYNKKMYRFYLLNSLFIRDFKSVSIEPNQIGKPTEKKLQDWLTFLLDIEDEKEREIKIRQDKKQAFLSKLEASGQKINWSNNKKSGWIESDLINYSFDILESGYVSERIVQRKQDLSAFLTLISK